nr:MAG TPA: hypothetical protein [Caudoviricetes sp.]
MKNCGFFAGKGKCLFLRTTNFFTSWKKPTGTSLSQPTAACSSRRKTARYRFPA